LLGVFTIKGLDTPMLFTFFRDLPLPHGIVFTSDWEFDSLSIRMDNGMRTLIRLPSAGMVQLVHEYECLNMSLHYRKSFGRANSLQIGIEGGFSYNMVFDKSQKLVSRRYDYQAMNSFRTEEIGRSAFTLWIQEPV
jgi:hypothetical protein